MLLDDERHVIKWLSQYGALTKTQVIRLLRDKTPETAEKILRNLKREHQISDVAGGYYLALDGLCKPDQRTILAVWVLLRFIDYVDPMAHYPAVYPSQIFFLKENTGYEIVVLYDGEQHLTDERMRVKLLQMTGIGNAKAIRFCKGALPILEWIHPDAYGYYMAAFYNHRFPGGMAHRDRNLRVAETIGMHLIAGVETKAYLLPALQNRAILRITPDAPAFYLARDFKRITPAEQNKTMFTRIVGAIFYSGSCYAVYNTRNAAMKWNGMGEFKALHSLTELARMNAGVQSIDSAILLGESYDTALTTLLESDKNRRLELRFDGIYRHIYFVPMNAGGIRQLRLLTVPDWKEKLLELLFDPDVRSYNRGFMEYDASIGGTCVFSHLDGDIARLIRFREAMQTGAGSFEVLCFDDQAPFLREYLGPYITLKTIDAATVEAELGL